MTVQEAYKIAKRSVGDAHILECYEYNKLYVFNVYSAEDLEVDKPLSTLWGVNKITGESKHFLPIHISPEEYYNGREIKNFKEL